jgi:hypothetical protein
MMALLDCRSYLREALDAVPPGEQPEGNPLSPERWQEIDSDICTGTTAALTLARYVRELLDAVKPPAQPAGNPMSPERWAEIRCKLHTLVAECSPGSPLDDAVELAREALDAVPAQARDWFCKCKEMSAAQKDGTIRIITDGGMCHGQWQICLQVFNPSGGRFPTITHCPFCGGRLPENVLSDDEASSS